MSDCEVTSVEMQEHSNEDNAVNESSVKKEEVTKAEEAATDYDEEEEARQAALKKLELWHLRLTCDRPATALGATCGAWVVMIVLFVVMISSFGHDFFPYEPTVPLYLRNHASKERWDAWVQAKETADYTPHSSGDRTIPQSVTRVKSEDLKLEILFIPTDGSDAFDMKNLQTALDVQNYILGLEGFRRYCELDWNTSTRLQYYEATEEERRAIEDNPPACKYHSTPLRACHPEDAANPNCEDRLASPAGLLDCNTYPKCRLQTIPLDEAFKSLKVDQYASMIPYQKETPQVTEFYSTIDSKFGNKTQTARAFRMTFYFGLPLKGFKTEKDNWKKQTEIVTDFLWDDLRPYLSGMHSGTPNMNIWYEGYGMWERYVLLLAIEAMMFAFGSMCFILVYIAFMNGSWWLSALGVLQIILSIFPGYFLYFGIFQQRYFGTFNGMSIFIILGIGADDIFVFLDTWRQAEVEPLLEGATKLQRYSWVLRKSGLAMFVTSITTMIAFLSNATSSFPAISTFGIFACMLVLVNYSAVMLFYPTVVSFYEEYLSAFPFCYGFPARLRSWLVRTNEGKDGKKATVFCGVCKREEPPHRHVPFPEEPRPSWYSGDHYKGIEWFFYHTWSDFILRFKYVILLVFAVWLGLTIYFASTLEPDPDFPQLFPDGDNFHEFLPAKNDHFTRGGTEFNLKLRLVWGIDKNHPIDRSGTNPAIGTDYGRVVWNDNFNLAKSLRCMRHFCEAVEVKDPKLRIGGAPEYSADCFPRAFHTYVTQTRRDASQRLWEESTGPNANQTLFAELAWDFFSDPELYEKWHHFVNAERVKVPHDMPEEQRRLLRVHNGYYPEMRFSYVDVYLTVRFDLNYKLGIQLWHDFNEWWEVQSRHPECAATAQSSDGFVFTNGFHYFFLQERMLQEAYSGIMLSLLLAFAILTVTTQNIVTGLYAGVCISLVVLSVMSFITFQGWKLGILESIILVMVPGLSVDFVAHLTEAYAVCDKEEREPRLRYALARVGISIVSGGLSTLGACTFLFFPRLSFFQKFGQLMFATIFFSLCISLMCYVSLLAAIGPSKNVGNLKYYLKRTRDYLQARFCAGQQAQETTKSEQRS